MDPTAQNNSNFQDPNATPATPIEPGQFVVSQSLSDPAPDSVPNPVVNLAGAAPPLGSSTQEVKSSVSGIPAAGGLDLSKSGVNAPDQLLSEIQSQAQDIVSPSGSAPSPALAGLSSAPPQLSVSGLEVGQAGLETAPEAQSLPGAPGPDPTPFAPQAMVVGGEEGAEGKPIFAKLKILFLIGGVLVLIGLISALAWFFLLNKKSAVPNKVENAETTVEEAPPIPKRARGGFGDLPVPTGSAQREATSGSQTPLDLSGIQ